MLGTLTPKLTKVLEEYLKPLTKTTPEDAILLDLLIKIGQMALLRRATFEGISTTHPIPINIYGIIFMPSGEGKDKPLRIIDKDLMSAYFKSFEILKFETYKEQKDQVSQKANEQFKKAGAERERYINENSPMELSYEIQDATMEGFLSMRQTFGQTDWGGVFVKIGEFADYISTRNMARMEFISSIVDVYDTGDSKPKIIKGQKHYNSVNGVPTVALLHTSPAGILGGMPKKQILQFLNRGLARRSFICYPENGTTGYEDFTAYREIIKETKAKQKSISELFTNACQFNRPKINFKITDEADEMLFYYQQECEHKANLLEEETLKPELKNRFWKTIKLAGLIAFFEHPGQDKITALDLDTAIMLAEHYGQYLQKFVESSELDDIEKLYRFFKRNLGKTLTTMDIRKSNIVPKERFSNWLISAIPEVELLAEKNNQDLITLTTGKFKQGKSYCLTTREDKVIKTNRAFTQYLTDELSKTGKN